MKNPKGFSPIIAIVIVLVVGLAASTAVYFTAREMATNTNENTNQAVVNENVNLNQNANLNSNTNAAVDETADWNTYTNETYNYSIKHPVDWTVSTALGIGHVQLVPPAPTGTGEIGPSIFIKYLANQDELDIVHNKKETTINGISVIQGSDDNALAETVVTYFKRDKEMIKVWWYKVYETQQYNKILNTLQFTDETAKNKETKNYFGLSLNGTYKATDLETGSERSFIPDGYTIVSQYSYNVFPKYLILRKENKLYKYTVNNSQVDLINLKTLKDKERVNVYDSISEKNKFYIVIDELGSELGMLPPVLSESKYFYDALNNNMVPADISIPDSSCYEYDSQYSRFFIWRCGEGIGSSLPLTEYNFKDNKTSEIIPLSDYPKSSDLGMVAVEYNDNAFLTIPKTGNSTYTHINAVFPSEKVEKVKYTIPDKFRNSGIYAYSALIDDKRSYILVGGGDSLLIMYLNANNEVSGIKTVKSEKSYLNFIFPYNEKIYYLDHQGKRINILNPETGIIEKYLSVTANEEITLLSLPIE